jgi:two-component system sensor histidine kinase CssS
MDTEARTQDLMSVHEILFESEYDIFHRFGLFRNLREVSHFVYTNNNISAPSRLPQRINMPSFDTLNLQPQLDRTQLNSWLADVTGTLMSKVAIRQSFNGIEYIFVISSLGEQTYLVSYVPNIHDNRTIYYVLVAGLTVIIVGLIAAKIVANYISKPLSTLEKFTEKVAAKDWKEPIILQNDDEIGRLAASMNKMQEALRRADEEEKLFLQSISHDLKTPVMIIMSHADAIIDGVYIDTPENTALIIKNEAISLSKRIKQLLYLNTLDYVLGNQSETSPIELDDLIRKVVSRLEILSGHLEWTINADKVAVIGNHEKLTVAIENILDNAIRYAKSQISVSLNQNGKTVRIELFNDGDPIGFEDMERIFENMYKDKTGNFGLGLAITRKIISYFGGNVYAQNKENGVSFIIEYPI